MTGKSTRKVSRRSKRKISRKRTRKMRGGRWTKKINLGRVTRKAKAIFKKKNNVSGEVLFEEVKGVLILNVKGKSM